MDARCRGTSGAHGSEAPELDGSAVESPSCVVCRSDTTDVLCDATEIRAQLAWLKRFHRARLKPRGDDALEDRADFTQDYTTNVVACRGCGLVFRDPRPKAEVVEETYAEDRYGEERLRALFDAQRELYRDKVRALRRWVPSGPAARVVEVGSFVGGFLAAVRDQCWTVLGVDPGREVTAFCHARGLPVVRGIIEDLDLPASSIDCVAVWNTFDQLPDPSSTLAAARRLLRPDGLIALRVPNGRCFRSAIAALRRAPSPLAGVIRTALAWNNLLAFPYLYGYSVPTLDRLLGRHGAHRLHVRPDTLVRLSDQSTRGWAVLEERALKAGWRAGWTLSGAVGMPPWSAAPWLDLYYRVGRDGDPT